MGCTPPGGELLAADGQSTEAAFVLAEHADGARMSDGIACCRWPGQLTCKADQHGCGG